MMRKNQLKVLMIVVFLSAVVIYGKLFFLQVVMGEYYSKLADGNRLKEEIIPAKRGRILDRKGKVLAEEIDFEGKKLRYYKPGELVAHVVGFVREGKGVMGIESRDDSILVGQNGVELWELNALGEKLRKLAWKDPVAGRDVILNIDLDLQEKAYFVLQEKLSQVGSGGAVVISQVDGEILSLVSLPAFDPNLFIAGGKRGIVGGDYATVNKVIEDEVGKPMFDRAISGQYPPGSVYKLVPAMAALEEGVIDSKTEFEDTGEIRVGQQRFGNWYFDKYGKVEGKINLVRALARSNDIFFYRLGERLGIDKLVKYSTKFGVGEKTGIDLEGETAGLLPNRLWRERKMGERWFLGNTYHMSIGQGDLLMSPLQVNRMTAAIVSGEKCVPRVDSGGNKNKDCESLSLSEENRKLVMQGMREACMKGGTAFVFFDLEGKVLCKTGTAQHGGEKAKPHAWINVVLPFGKTDNWLVITVMIENAGEGSEMAGPVARGIVDYLIEIKSEK